MLFAFAILVSAFTLFFLEPFCGKLFTPWFGGGPAVWGTCLVIFQVLLLGGYLLAHGLSRLSPRRQLVTWIGAAVVAWLSLLLTWQSSGTPFMPVGVSLVGASETPVRSLMILLLQMVAGPFLLLASSSALLQAWYARVYPGRSPFRLYALSNLGSFAGLFGYPLLAEPFMATSRQGWLLLALFGVYTALMAFAAWMTYRHSPNLPVATPEKHETKRVWSWLLASASGSLLLVSASTSLASFVGSIPLIWIMPLGLYLLTFVLVFDARWDFGKPRWMMLLALLAATCFGVLLFQANYNHAVWITLAMCGVVLFGGLLCHGYLYARRPGHSTLTFYYLTLAAGGALGGILGGLVAPVVFNRIYELPAAVVLAGLCGLLWLIQTEKLKLPALKAVPMLLLIGVGLFRTYQMAHSLGYPLRDFFGALVVIESGQVRMMAHGMTRHGVQVLNRPDLPLSYYGTQSGLGRAMEVARARKDHLKIGMLGLGAGAAAAYARPGDEISIYEISPLVLGPLAGPQGVIFTHVSACGAKVETALGDGRLNLAKDRIVGSKNFDVLLVDAFVGGQIPWHLLTREALDLYLSHLSEDGILVLHLSTTHSLERLVAAQARDMDLWGLVFYHPSLETGTLSNPWESPSIYVLLSRTEAIADGRLFRAAKWAVLPRQPQVPVGPMGKLKGMIGEGMAQGIRPWTDDRNDMGQLLLMESTETVLVREVAKMRQAGLLN